MRETLFKAYWRVERTLCGDLRNAQEHYERMLEPLVADGASWLDLGCGHQVLPQWREQAETALVGRAGVVVGTDMERDALRAHRSITRTVCADGGALPFATGSFDLVTANMVLEHLPQPGDQFAEVARVLRPGGRFVFHTPNALGHPTVLARLLPEWAKSMGTRLLEGRHESDRFRTFYRCNAVPEVRALAAGHGFEVIDARLVSTTAMFAVVLPLAALELLWIRALQADRRQHLRSNLLVVLGRMEGAAA